MCKEASLYRDCYEESKVRNRTGKSQIVSFLLVSLLPTKVVNLQNGTQQGLFERKSLHELEVHQKRPLFRLALARGLDWFGFGFDPRNILGKTTHAFTRSCATVPRSKQPGFNWWNRWTLFGGWVDGLKSLGGLDTCYWIPMKGGMAGQHLGSETPGRCGQNVWTCHFWNVGRALGFSPEEKPSPMSCWLPAILFRSSFSWFGWIAAFRPPKVVS